MDFQNCSLCSSLKDYERGFQKSGEGIFLPDPTNKLIVLYDLKPDSCELEGNPPFKITSSRLLQLRQCPQCETFYLYREDYEFIWGGSEDEQILERLTDEQALICLEKLEPTEPMRNSSLNLTQQEMISREIEKNKHYIIEKLENALESRDYERMVDALKCLDEGAYAFPELIRLLQRIAGATFYNFDDNGAGGFPRPDVRFEFNFKLEALSAIEKIKAKAELS